MIKKAILLTLLLSQPALALDTPTRARDYTTWLNDGETKSLTIRTDNAQWRWVRIKANNTTLDNINGVFFTESGKRRFYHGPFLMEE